MIKNQDQTSFQGAILYPKKNAKSKNQLPDEKDGRFNQYRPIHLKSDNNSWHHFVYTSQWKCHQGLQDYRTNWLNHWVVEEEDYFCSSFLFSPLNNTTRLRSYPLFKPSRIHIILVDTFALAWVIRKPITRWEKNEGNQTNYSRKSIDFFIHLGISTHSTMWQNNVWFTIY